MLLTSALGVAASTYWPTGWTDLHSETSAEDSSSERVKSWTWSYTPAWSTMLLARFPEHAGVDEQAAWGRLTRMMAFATDLHRSSHVDRIDRFGEKQLDWWIEYRTGWPWTSWSAKHFAEPSAEGVAIRREHFVIVSDPTGFDDEGIVVPYQPVWSGIILNSLVGAAGTWALIFLPSAVRTVRRRRRGRCVACGYDLAGVDGGECPECGGGRGNPPAEEAF
jgi:hypothetical protein